MKPTGLLAILNKFAGRRIAVAGDFMIDHFIWGSASRLSAEAPVPVVECVSETYHPGGAGNVAANLASLGASVFPFGVIGRDPAARLLIDALRVRGVGTGMLIATSDRPTTRKLRIVETGRKHQIARVDTESTQPLRRKSSERLAAALLAGRFDAVIVSDYNKGVVTPGFLSTVLPALRKRGIPVFLDPRPANAALYRPISAITPNRKEAEEITGIAIRDDQSLHDAASAILQMSDSEAVLITLSDAGMALLEPGRSLHRIPTVSREVYDVTGAGDTVIATFALARACGASYVDAATIANHAAGIVVGHVGTATPMLSELRETLKA